MATLEMETALEGRQPEKKIVRFLRL